MVKKVKAAFSFAHLIGLGAARAEGDQDDNQNQDEERKQRDGESDEDYAERMEELDKKESEGEGDPNGEDGQDDPEAEDDAGESDKEKAARAKERARCAAIFGSKAAGSRPDVAAHLAFNTSMRASAAISMLNAFASGAPAAAAPARQSLASRMSGVQTPNVGASGAAAPANSAQGTAAMILAAGKKRRGES